MTHYLKFISRVRGNHVHASVWSAMSANETRPTLAMCGELVMTIAEWAAFKKLLEKVQYDERPEFQLEFEEK